MVREQERVRGVGRGQPLAIAMGLILIFIFFSPGASFELSADSIAAGKNVIITGTSEPNSENTFLTSFTMSLPVTSGKYSYETEVKVPNKPNSFAVTARNVKNLDAGVKMGIWITKSFEASGGVVHLSRDDLPPGRYKLRVSGSALPGKSEVPITVEAETRVVADSKGRYKLIIDTTGIPEGEYLIEGDDDAKTVQILSKDKNNVKPSATTSSDSESNAEKLVQEEAGAEEKSTAPAQSGQSKGVVARLTEWLGL